MEDNKLIEVLGNENNSIKRFRKDMTLSKDGKDNINMVLKEYYKYDYGYKIEIPKKWEDKFIVIETFEDINSALKGNKKIIKQKNKGTNEEIIAVSVPLYYLNNISGVLRYVVSIESVDKIILNIFIFSILVGIIVIVITFLFSSFLVKDIVNPIEELTDIAQIMAGGDFSTKAVKRNNDEIGKLSDTLN